MAFEIGHTDQAGATGFAHKELLLRIQALAEANGWVTLRYDTTVSASHELILKGEGLAGQDEIFVGFKTYESSDADYYNLVVAGFTGFVESNGFYQQPGYAGSGVPAHNQRVDYWLAVNPQRIAIGLKVGTPVYQTAYVGFFLPYAKPTQYPYPMCVIGMLDGAAATRYSDTTYSMGFKGSSPGSNNKPNCLIRWLDGSWIQPECYPWNSIQIGGSGAQLRDTNGNYPVARIVLCKQSPRNVYGELDGFGYVSNFDNTVESLIKTDQGDWICLQDVYRTSFNDYLAMRMS